MLCVHKIKDQNPTNIKLDANHINDMNNKKNNKYSNNDSGATTKRELINWLFVRKKLPSMRVIAVCN